MLSRLRQFLSSLSPFLLGVCVVSNLVLSCQAVRRVGDSTSVVVTNYVDVVSVVTNSPSSDLPFSAPVGSVSPRPNGSESDIAREVARTDYVYFVCGRRIGAHMFGRYYYDGSPCSWGRIREIYPDRILLADGNWISNTRFIGGRKDG